MSMDIELKKLYESLTKQGFLEAHRVEYILKDSVRGEELILCHYELGLLAYITGKCSKRKYWLSYGKIYGEGVARLSHKETKGRFNQYPSLTIINGAPVHFSLEVTANILNDLQIVKEAYSLNGQWSQPLDYKHLELLSDYEYQFDIEIMETNIVKAKLAECPVEVRRMMNIFTKKKINMLV